MPFSSSSATLAALALLYHSIYRRSSNQGPFYGKNNEDDKGNHLVHRVILLSFLVGQDQLPVSFGRTLRVAQDNFAIGRVPVGLDQQLIATLVINSKVSSLISPTIGVKVFPLSVESLAYKAFPFLPFSGSETVRIANRSSSVVSTLLNRSGFSLSSNTSSSSDCAAPTL